MDLSSQLWVDDLLQSFVEGDLLPGTGVAPQAFWSALEAILADFTPSNDALLKVRDDLQAQIDAWWRERRGQPYDVAEATAYADRYGIPARVQPTPPKRLKLQAYADNFR